MRTRGGLTDAALLATHLHLTNEGNSIDHLYRSLHPAAMEETPQEGSIQLLLGPCLDVVAAAAAAVLMFLAAANQPLEALFGCCWIHFNPYVLVWIEVEFSSNFTPIYLNTCGLM